ncbi:HvfC/BufC N-terminal domain-containing protein [Novosphingobium malaysiense]|uniref:HvfC/BufC N-terminal domain-containing protein n=1 Tax=Novosphingobium malaysiense TaxID=1348853 RepID=UPI00068EEE09|nr:DNA-binding domain-containing protein [Novosphingobium malaysiense]
MRLALLQSQFLEGLRSDASALPAHWKQRERAGYAIYREAYRARLIAALHETYPRTARLVGNEAFQKAAAHHVITSPPTSWTLDDAGRGFAQTLEDLFRRDPEVAELAWIEWAMQNAFSARDMSPLDASGFSNVSAQFADEDWHDMRLDFVPALALRQVNHDCRTLWRALAQERANAAVPSSPLLPEPAGCAVWREGLRATFTMLDGAEARALAMMIDGAGYGAACELLVALMGEEQALSVASAMLGRWLSHGWIASVNSSSEGASHD